MDLNTPLSDIGANVIEAMERLFPALAGNTLLLFSGIALLCIGGCVLCRALLLRKAGWLNAEEAPKKFHYTLMILLIVFLILQATHGLSGLPLLFMALSAGAVLSAVIGLFTWRSFGVTAAVLAIWLTLPLREFPTLLAHVRDYNNLSYYSIPGKVGVYTVAVYGCGRFIAYALIAAVLSVFTVAYYTRRRYLFKESIAAYFTNLTNCPKCGRPLVNAGNFCKYCGASVAGRGYSELKWKPLESEKYCSNCGLELKDSDECPVCGNPQTVGQIIKKEAKKALGDELKKYLVIGIVAALVIVPVLISDPLKYLTKGSAAVTNTYIEYLNEWHRTPSAADDKTWLASYDEASEALYAMNARGFTIVPERLTYSDTYVYIQYLDASYYQMAVMERINAAVHANDPASFSGLGSYFNETMNMQTRALASGTSVILQGGSMLRSAEYIAADSVRFYLSFIPVLVRIILFFLLGALSLGFGIFLMLKAPDPSPFKTVMLTVDTAEERAAQKERLKAARRSDRIIAVIAAAIVAVFFCAAALIESRTQKEPELTYEAALDAGFTVPGTALAGWFSECASDPADALAEKDNVLAVLEKSAPAVAYLADSYIPATEGEDAEDTAKRVTAQKTAAALRDVFSSVRAKLEANELPDRSTAAEAVRLLTEGMKLDQEIKINEAFDALKDLF